MKYSEAVAGRILYSYNYKNFYFTENVDNHKFKSKEVIYN